MNFQLSTVLSEEQIQNRVKELGQKLTERFNGETIVAVCVLKGSFMFYADLIRAIDTEVICEFYGVSSYEGLHSTGEVKTTLDLATPIKDRHVVLIEDIVDTGLTMHTMQLSLKARAPKSLTTVSLLHKPECKKVDCEIDEIGFEIPNDFVVGYGLDYQGQFRNLPYLAAINNLN